MPKGAAAAPVRKLMAATLMGVFGIDFVCAAVAFRTLTVDAKRPAVPIPTPATPADLINSLLPIFFSVIINPPFALSLICCLHE